MTSDRVYLTGWLDILSRLTAREVDVDKCIYLLLLIAIKGSAGHHNYTLAKYFFLGCIFGMLVDLPIDKDRLVR